MCLTCKRKFRNLVCQKIEELFADGPHQIRVWIELNEDNIYPRGIYEIVETEDCRYKVCVTSLKQDSTFYAFWDADEGIVALINNKDEIIEFEFIDENKVQTRLAFELYLREEWVDMEQKIYDENIENQGHPPDESDSDECDSNCDSECDSDYDSDDTCGDPILICKECYEERYGQLDESDDTSNDCIMICKDCFEEHCGDLEDSSECDYDCNTMPNSDAEEVEIFDESSINIHIRNQVAVMTTHIFKPMIGCNVFISRNEFPIGSGKIHMDKENDIISCYVTWDEKMSKKYPNGSNLTIQYDWTNKSFGFELKTNNVREELFGFFLLDFSFFQYRKSCENLIDSYRTTCNCVSDYVMNKVIDPVNKQIAEQVAEYTFSQLCNDIDPSKSFDFSSITDLEVNLQIYISSTDAVTIDVSMDNTAIVDTSTTNVSTVDVSTVDVSTVDVSTVDVFTVDVSTVDVSTVDVSTVDVSTVNACHANLENISMKECETLFWSSLLLLIIKYYSVELKLRNR